MNKSDVTDILLQKNFGDEESFNQSTFLAPASAMNMTVDIDLIKPYENNPRKAENEKFLEIKESIREIGLQQPFSITCKPGHDYFIIRSGGNTRLRALKELYDETKEVRFKSIICYYEPFTDDLELLSLHMMENEQRGRMLFIDIAEAAKAFKALLENQLGESIGLRPLSAEMKKRGWSVHYSVLGFYLYATEISDELPIAFRTGLGRKFVTDLRKLEELVKRWSKDRLVDEQKSLQYFKNVLNENDSEASHFKIDKVYHDLYQRFSTQFQLRFNDVVNDFKILLGGGNHRPESDEDDYHSETDHQLNGPNFESGHSGLSIADSEGAIESGPHFPGAGNFGSDQLRSETDTPKIPIDSNKRAPRTTEQQRLTYQIKESILWMVKQVDRFDEIFIPTNDAYLFDITINAKDFKPSSGRSFFKADVLGIWYALYFRLESIRIVVDAKNNPMVARDALSKLADGQHLHNESLIPCLISHDFMQNCAGFLPKELIDSLCSSIQPEIRNIYAVFPQLDRLIKDYINQLRS